MKKTILLRLAFSSLLLGGDVVYADISGQVFTDYNLNGNLDSTGTISNYANTMSISTAVDQGVEGVTIQATCVTGSGSANFSAVTNAQGQFTIATPNTVDGAQNCLLNLSSLPSVYTVGSQSTSDSNVLTQFVSPNASNIQFTVKQALSYCQNNPDLATNRYAYGQQTPNAPYAGNNDVTNIFAFPYNSGTAGAPKTSPAGAYSPNLDTNEAGISNLALANQVGSVFGLGWHAASKSLFAAAYMKGWTGFGPGGTGAIYRVNLTDPANPTTSIYADLNQIYPATPATTGDDPYLTGIFSVTDPGYVQIADGSTNTKGSYVASGNTSRDNQEGQIANAVGKTAFGDLDVSKDGKSLFVTSMANRKLYILPLRDTPLTPADASSISSYDIPPPPECAWGLYTVFGLGEYENSLYVGSSCSIYGDNNHAIMRFDLTTKQFDTNPTINYRSDVAGYKYLPFVVSDLVFDSKGNMTIATRSSFNPTQQYNVDMSLSAAYGFVFHACVQNAATHTWSLENNGSCGGITTLGKDDGQGLGGGRYFYQEWSADQSPTAGIGTSYGGAAQVPGFREMAYTVADPFTVYEAGVAWLDVGLGDPATAGQRNRAYGFYRGTGAFDGYPPDNRPINGKNAAIGDLEVLCDAPPVEIGNRVWKDTNGNGIQNAGEPPLAGVRVELFAQGADLTTANPLATALTDSEGYYVFSNDLRGYPATGNSSPNDTTGAGASFNPLDIQGGRASTASHKYGLKDLLANTGYQVVIRQINDPSQQAALKDLTLTQLAQGTDVELNSDGGLVDNAVVATVTTSEAGYAYHAIDFGFIEPPTDLKLTKTLDKPSAKRGETVIYTLTLSNESVRDATNIQVSDALPSGLSLVQATASSGTFTAGVWSLSKVLANTSETLQIEAMVN